MQSWYYDEFQQAGLDYSDTLTIETYDKHMQRFRDYEKEACNIMTLLELPPDSHVLEIGTGTGHFARAAAAVYGEVTAYDVSKGMLAYAAEKVRESAISNITWVNKGFLSLDAVETYDAVVTNAALHHLPDLWKAVALRNIYAALKPGAKLYLGDVIFSFAPASCGKKLPQWIKQTSERLGSEKMDKEGVLHLSEEYSTFDWVIEKLLTETGFTYEVVHKDDFFAAYLAVKRDALV